MGRKKVKGEERFSFQPNISKKTNHIAANYRSKIAESINEQKITTVEWLAATGNKEVWRENAKQLLYEEEMKKCTFKPHVSQYKPMECSVRERSRHNSKSRSKDLMINTNDKCNDLYELSK